MIPRRIGVVREHHSVIESVGPEDKIEYYSLGTGFVRVVWGERRSNDDGWPQTTLLGRYI
jgi:hypothetical protein